MTVPDRAAARPLVVAIDGPAGAGKSTVARAVAERIGFVLVDTGAIYRTLALVALRKQASLDDEDGLSELAAGLRLEFVDHRGGTQVRNDGEDVTDAIRSAKISRAAGQVASFGRVRAALTAMQRAFAARGNAVLEGRDIGTVICPQADVKIFLDASLAERARRRFEELRARGEADSLAEVERELDARDARDRSRQTAPLQAAPDAIRLDCTAMAPDEVVATIVARVRAAAARGTNKANVEDAAHVVWAAATAKGPKPVPLADETTQIAEARIIEDFFALGLAARFAAQPSLTDVLHGTILFIVEQAGESLHVLLDCRQTPVRVSRVASGAEADCTLGVPADKLVAMIEGKLNPQLAFMRGQLRVQGDVAMSMRLGALFV